MEASSGQLPEPMARRLLSSVPLFLRRCFVSVLFGRGRFLCFGCWCLYYLST